MLSKSEQTVFNQLELLIAGLVKGASKGEGLGNKFLSNLSNVDAIIHLVRCFEDDDITHVNNMISPIDDIKIIETELLISDLEKAEKIMENYLKKNKGKKLDQSFVQALEISKKLLEDGKFLREKSFSANSITF